MHVRDMYQGYEYLKSLGCTCVLIVKEAYYMSSLVVNTWSRATLVKNLK